MRPGLVKEIRQAREIYAATSAPTSNHANHAWEGERLAELLAEFAADPPQLIFVGYSDITGCQSVLCRHCLRADYASIFEEQLKCYYCDTVADVDAMKLEYEIRMGKGKKP